MIEEVDLHPSEDPRVKNRRRVSSIDDGHARIAPYAHDIRLVLYPEEKILDTFKKLCKVSEIDVKLDELRYPNVVETHGPKNSFFQAKTLHRLKKWFEQLPFSVSFQLEALLRDRLLTPRDIFNEPIFSEVNGLAEGEDTEASEKLAQLLIRFRQTLQISDPFKETPGHCFLRTKQEFKYFPYDLPGSSFQCYHLTFTPTRVLLEGPYAVQSNRIMRRYPGRERNFMRVDFRDEDRLQYRWDYHVDGTQFLQDRVGGVLKNGFEIGGQYFRFLAYSSSALREHAVWFMHDFQSANGEWVTPETIRGGLGDFSNLLKQPSKLAARVAQAFTATDPSVEVHRHEWEEIDDMKDLCKPANMFTDGCGIISKTLGDRIWAKLISRKSDPGASSIKPWVYQIRFLGFKGVVCVSPILDNHPKGIQMQLRTSMKKFENSTDETADIEIARAFDYPNHCYLNRPLVMILEDRNVRLDVFKRLQQESVREVYTIDESISKFYTVLRNNSLGGTFRLGWILQRIEGLMGIEPDDPDMSWDNAFWLRLRSVAVNHVLRDIKHRARIRIPDSHMLVGVADEGPRYEAEGLRNVYKLPAGQIYACIQNPYDSQPTWLEGLCLIARNPVVHPGDVQHVTAIGKPPQGYLCSFLDVVNAVVLPSQGKRALASCLSGGDVDGDQFVVIQCESLLAATHHPASKYAAAGVRTLDRECSVNDVCDFIVEYIQSDVLGLLSIRHLIIADQSKEGTKDPKCLRISEMCSQAVDYPKNGIPVDTTNLPKTLMRCNPDWQAAEVLKPRDTDFYHSDRALGHLYRAITLAELPEETKPDIPPLQDAVSVALQNELHDVLSIQLEDEVPSAMLTLFNKHVGELRCVAATHTISNTPGATLIEEELVVGTILAKCSQNRWRSSRIQRMLYHTVAHVHTVKGEIFPSRSDLERQDYVEGIQRAWSAWTLSQERGAEFGAASFGLIALGVIFDLMERMDKMPNEA